MVGVVADARAEAAEREGGADHARVADHLCMLQRPLDGGRGEALGDGDLDGPRACAGGEYPMMSPLLSWLEDAAPGAGSPCRTFIASATIASISFGVSNGVVLVGGSNPGGSGPKSGACIERTIPLCPSSTLSTVV